MARPAPSAPRTPLTRERVLDAAIALADEQGLEAVTMRGVGQSLGVEGMALYRHVGNKDGLLAGMIDRAAGDIAVPDPDGEWRAELRRRYVSAYRVMTTHRWMPAVMMDRLNVGPNMLALTDATIGCLRRAGFTHAQLDGVWVALDSHLYGFALQEVRAAVSPEEIPDATRQHLPLISAESHPHLHAMAEWAMDPDYPGTPPFEFGLDVLLDAFDRLRPA